MTTQIQNNTSSAYAESGTNAAGSSHQQPIDSVIDENGITFTLLESSGNQLLTKSYEKENEDLKKTAGAVFGNGTYEEKVAANMEAFKVWRDCCASNQAFMYGVTKLGKRGKIRPRDYLPADYAEKEMAARIKACFEFPEGPAIVAIDYDPPKDGAVLSGDDLVNILYQVAPCLRDTTLLLAPSASSGIVDEATGRVLKGQGGQRVYFAVQAGTDIRRVFEILHIRLWLAGHGRIEVSASGAMLVRSPVDLAMRNPVQPDFAAPAVLGPGLRSDRPASKLIGEGGPLDSHTGIPDLSEQEMLMYSSLLEAEKKKVEPLAQSKREAWIAQRKPKLAKNILQRRGKSLLDTTAATQSIIDAEETLYFAVERSVLTPEFVLVTAKGDPVTVEEVLTNLVQYEGHDFRDPLEPNYGGGRAVSKIYSHGTNVFLYSYARGGQRYVLKRHQIEIQVQMGETANCVNTTKEFLKGQPTIFSLGDAMGQVMPSGGLMTFSENTLAQYLGEVVRYCVIKPSERGDLEVKKVDPPAKVCKTILEMGGHRGLNSLIGVVTAPTMLPDGRLVLDPGYCAETGLYLHAEKDVWGDIPREPTKEQLLQAFETLWLPYSQFPWSSAIDRGVVLSLLLTALTRRCFTIAPGYGFDAASQSSGKTKAAQVAVALLTGCGQDGLIPFPGKVNEEEISKLLLSAAMGGNAAMLFDNAIGLFETSALAAAMTAGSIEGRVLGASKMSGRMPFRPLILLTGNNVSLGPDTAQRILVARIDPAVEKPELRSFSFDPVQVAEERRTDMVIAGLTLLQGYVAAGKPIIGQGCSRFAQWDRLVRQATIWLSQELGLDFGDPIKALEAHTQGNPEQEDLLTLLRGWRKVFNSEPVTTGEFLERIEEIEYRSDIEAEVRAMVEVVRGWGQTGRLPVHRSLGRALGNRVGRIAGKMRLVKAAEATGGYQRWQVIEM